MYTQPVRLNSPQVGYATWSAVGYSVCIIRIEYVTMFVIVMKHNRVGV